MKSITYFLLTALILTSHFCHGANELEQITSKAASGDANAQYELAQIYTRGQIVERNEAEAFKWFLQAAQKGHLEAQFKVGKCFIYGKGTEMDKTTGISWLQSAGEKNHVEAQYEVGRCFFQWGGGVSPTYSHMPPASQNFTSNRSR